MKRFLLVVMIVISVQIVSGQAVEKYIKEESVARIIKTLSADDMMGRSASRPAQIEKATAFLETEFKKIGLKHFSGLTTYRQEFKKEMIAPSTIEVTINGNQIAKENVVIASEKTSINLTQDLVIKTIDFEATIANKRRHLISQAFNFVRDDSFSAIIVVAPEFESEFKELNSFFGKRYLNGRTSTKLFVLGKYDIQSYAIKATQKMELITMANVVGILPGKSKPDEFVIFSGHYDHIGIRSAEAGDSIANGADDDASGTTAVIELARYFRKVKNNQRTLIFVAFTAEEIGGFGSKYFSEQLNPDKVVAMFNIEMIGKPSLWGQNFAFITGYERSDFGEILQKNLKGTSFEFRPDPYPTQNLFYRSDNATLARLGVPAHTISTDEIDIDKLYHTVNDEVETLDMKNITHTIQAIALSANSIVNGTDTPKRIDKALVH